MKILLKWKYWILFFMVAAIIGLDQLTKLWIVDQFRLGESFSVIPDFFSITYVQNKGAAFGFLAKTDPSFRIPFFIIVPLMALGSIGFIFRKIPKEDLLLSFSFALVIAGAIGNLIDRLHYGYVIDFLDFHWRWNYHFPAFNVADSSICIGVGLVMLDLFTSTEDDSTQEKGSAVNASHPH